MPRPMLCQRQAVEHVLQMVSRYESRVRLEKLPQGMGRRPLPDNTADLDRLRFAGFEDLLGEIRAAAGLDEQVASAGQAEHRHKLVPFLDEMEISGIEVAAQARSERRQGRQQEQRGVHVTFQEAADPLQV